jgi:predicted PurR-regulated permease PerM
MRSKPDPVHERSQRARSQRVVATESLPAGRLRVFEDRTFLLLVVAISIAFAWILWPFYGALFWATILAILFSPLYRQLLHAMRGRRNLAAFSTLAIVLVMVILPLSLITAQEGFSVYDNIRSGDLELGGYLRKMMDSLPAWASDLLDRLGLSNLRSLQQRLSSSLTAGIQFFATRAFSIGQNALEFLVSLAIMLYLMFFLLRDGRELLARMRPAIPLREELQRRLSRKFTDVIRATIKGNFVVAIVQGALGGVMFWVLGIRAPLMWAVLMAFLSLLPAVGSALVWLPAAIYLLLNGAVWQGIVLIAYGVLVIGLVDNLLRPVLVGKDTKMPDYVVLISTLGGIAIFGFKGFVIGPVIAALFIAVWDTVATARANSRIGSTDA